MSLEVTHAIWNELKGYLTPVDKENAAETLVEVLVQHDYELTDILEEFKGDALVKAAVVGYADETIETDDEDYGDDEDDEYNEY